MRSLRSFAAQLLLFRVSEPFRQFAIGINPPVAEEGPVGAGGVHVSQIHGDEEVSFLGDSGLGEDFAGGAGDEALPPEFQAVAAHAGEDFVADAVDGGDVAAVGDGVGALDGFPRSVLALAVFGLFAGMPADGGRVEKDFRALHGSQAGGFGIPLVPADEDADLGVTGLPRAEAEVAGSEIELFVEERVVRYVHLAVDAKEGAVGVNDGGGVMVEAGGAFLEKGGDEDDPVLAGESLEGVGARARNRFGEGEVGVIFTLAEILGAEEFLGADDLGTGLGGALDGGEGTFQVGGGVGPASVLEQAQRYGGGVRWTFHRGSLKAELPPTRDANRDGGTTSANGGWPRGFVRRIGHTKPIKIPTTATSHHSASEPSNLSSNQK